MVSPTRRQRGSRRDILLTLSCPSTSEHLLFFFFTGYLSLTHLYGSVSRTCDKPLIPRLHSNGPHPAEVTTDDLSDKTCYCYKKINAAFSSAALCWESVSTNKNISRKTICSYPKQFPWWMPLGFRHGWCFPHQWGISGAASFNERLK